MAETLLRVGVLSDGPLLQRWQVDCLERLRAVPGVELVLWITPKEEAAETLPLLQRLKSHPWRSALYRQYRKRYFRPRSMEEVDSTTAFGGVTRLRCAARKEGGAQHFLSDDLEAIRAHRPDVLIRFGFGIVRGAILDLPTYGVWSFHHGDEEKYRGGPPGFWEIMNNDAITGAVLQRLTDKLDAGRILRKGWFQTVDHSLAGTVDFVLGQSACWPALVCTELLNGNAAAAEGVLSTTTAPVYRYPGNFTFLRFLRKQAMNKLRFHKEQLQQHEEWNIGVLHAPISSLLKDDPSMNVRWLPPTSKGGFRADPFGYVNAEGELNVLYEKYAYADRTGVISRVRPKRDNSLKRSRTLLATGSHLSYPYVVVHEGMIFVIPETAAEGKVDLYRLSADGERLEQVCTLLQEPVFDPTLFQHDGRWWLFGTVPPLSNVTLHAWYSDRLEGPWRPHALNPLKQDVRSSRSGGTPFTHQGELYRPAQDSEVTYGHRIAINRIRELSPTTFREETIKHIGPLKGTAYNQGMHTLSAVGEYTLVDGKRFIHLKEHEKQLRKEKLEKLKRRRE